MIYYRQQIVLTTAKKHHSGNRQGWRQTFNSHKW